MKEDPRRNGNLTFNAPSDTRKAPRRYLLPHFMITIESTPLLLRYAVRTFSKSIGFCSTTTIRNGSIFCHASEPKRGRLLKTLEQAQTIDICWKVMFPATSTVAESTLPNLALPACLGRKGRKSKLHEDRGAPFRYLTWRSSTAAGERGRRRSARPFGRCMCGNKERLRGE